MPPVRVSEFKELRSWPGVPDRSRGGLDRRGAKRRPCDSAFRRDDALPHGRRWAHAWGACSRLWRRGGAALRRLAGWYSGTNRAKISRVPWGSGEVAAFSSSATKRRTSSQGWGFDAADEDLGVEGLLRAWFGERELLEELLAGAGAGDFDLDVFADAEAGELDEILREAAKALEMVALRSSAGRSSAHGRRAARVVILWTIRRNRRLISCVLTSRHRLESTNVRSPTAASVWSPFG
jgi:hypothetical protein